MGACLEGPPPLSLPLGTLVAGTGSVGPCLPAARVGRHQAGRPARGGTEAPLSLLSGPAGTIATLRTRNVAGMLVQEVTSPLLPPPHASPALLTCSSGYLFQDECHFQMVTLSFASSPEAPCSVPEPCWAWGSERNLHGLCPWGEGWGGDSRHTG